ncbi:MAG: VWA domain-containing protein [Phycisphaerales bacterium]
MTVRLTEPGWLLLVIAAVPLAVVGVLWLRAMSPGRRWCSVLLRVLLMAVAACTLAGATLNREVDRLCVVAIVDVSGSVQRLFDPGVDRQGRPRSLWSRIGPLLDRGALKRRADDLSAVVVFGSDAVVAAAPQVAPAGEFIASDPELTAYYAGAARSTDLAGALRTAAAIVPPGASARFVLVSDGVPTTGDFESVLSQVAARSGGSRGGTAPVPIDTVCLTYDVPNDVMVESVESPAATPAESTVRVRVSLSSAAPVAGTLELSREGEAVDINGDLPGTSRPVVVGPGRTTLLLPVRLPAGRVHRFEAVFTPLDGPDPIPDNNRGSAVTLTPGRSSILVIDGVGGGDRSSAGATLADALSGSGVEVELIAPERVRADQLWLQRYDLIVLQNVPADALGAGVAQVIADYVTSFGGGLVMVGGPDSFGAGGWKGTPIEPILPVVLDLPERLVAPAAAVVIIIDCSGSMGFRVMGTGRTQQQIANEGAAAAVLALDKSDLLGVITFNESHRVLVPLGPNRDPEASAAKVRSILPDGGTNLPPALLEAHRQLRAAKADIKHVIVLSDGVSQGANLLPEMCERLKEDGIRVSTIAVGDQADAMGMRQMAASGDGTFYMVSDPSLLPRIFVKAVRVVRSPQIRLGAFTPRLLATGSPLVDGLSDPLPSLNGLVLTQARLERSAVTPIVTPTGEPVLAHWAAGVGQVGAFTSDAHFWSRPWLDQPAYTRLWTQVVRGLARAQPDRGQELVLEADGDELRVRVTATDEGGRPRDRLSITGWVHSDDGSRQALSLLQTGPGEYEGAVRAAGEGNRIVTLTPTLDGRPMPPLVGGVSGVAGAEFRTLRADEGFMTRIAERTGGAALALRSGGDDASALMVNSPDLFDRSGITPVVARTPVWPLLLAAMVAVYLLDVGCRRIAWDRLFSPEFGRSFRRAASETVRERGEAAARAVGRLRETDLSLKRRFEAGAQAAGEPPKLSVDDAKAVLRAEQERRRRVRAAARAEKNVGAAPMPGEPERSAQKTDVGRTAQTPPSLLEAKRRARRKMDEGGD